MTASPITETARYLTFTLDEETYAIEISQVREVLEYAAVTRVPRCFEFMRGVTNVRGNIVAVIDLKLRFGMPMTEPTRDTRSVILEVNVDGTRIVVGALADSVLEVVELEPDQIEPPPSIGTRLDIAFVRGMGKRNGELVILLDMDRVFSAETAAVPEVVGGADANAAAS